jgi:hypothetical protein
VVLPLRSPGSPRLPSSALLTLLVAVSLLSHLRAAVPGLTYYFRDFTTAFVPLRLFAAAELRAGRWPLWNPYVQEGTFALPAFYPLDLLHALKGDPATISWLLTLHYPIAALGCFALARGLGAGRPGAFAAGAVYALGGFAASCLNLYVYLQALALAPFVALALRRVAVRGGRSVAVAGLAVGLSLTTLAIEFVAQAVVLGCCLGLVAAPRLRAAARLATALVLGLGLAALPVAVMLGILRESIRGAGFDPSVALGNEVHPATLLQILVPGLFGSLSAPVEEWWGGRFFTKGFPYFLSLYLGPLALSLAAVAPPAVERRVRWLLLLLGAAALWYCLGARGGLASLVSQVPLLRFVRFPSKAFLIPHTVVALLAGFGVERLRARSGWLRFSAVAGALGAGVFGLLVFLQASAGDGLVPWEFAGVRATVVRGCASTAALCLGGAGLGLAVGRHWLPLRAGLLAVLALLVFDLARAGHGINPQVDPAFFRPLPEMAAEGLGDLGGGRVFTYGLDYSEAFARFLKQEVPGRGLWSFFLSRQVLAPYANMVDRVEAAEAKDLTSFVARPAELRPEDYDPAAVGGILDRLRDAAVRRVLSLDPLDHPDLRLRAAVPAGPPGLTIHVYELLRPWPRAYLACRGEAAVAGPGVSRRIEIEGAAAQACASGSVRPLASNPQEARYEVEAAGSGFLVTRDTFARGWSATVDGRAMPVLRANGKHRAVPIEEGRHQVVLRYRAPGLRGGVLVSVLSGIATVVGLFLRPGRPDATQWA